MDFSKLTEYLDSLGSLGVPATSIAVAQNHKVIYSHTQGFSDYENTVPLKLDDIFILYSATKPITAAAVMLATEQGLFSLDDKLCRYLPEYEHMKLKLDNGTITDAKNPITIRNLMCMGAGLTYNFNSKNLSAAAKDKNSTTRSLVRALAADPLIFEPGTDYCYSLCLDVAAAVIEVTSGMSFGEYLNKYIIMPLGMRDTCFKLNDTQKERLVAQYDNASGSICPCEQENIYQLSEKYESGGAGLYSTATDYSRFADMLACSGEAATGERILSKQSVDIMRTNQLCPKAQSTFWKKGYGYGIGVRTLIDPVLAESKSPIGEFGWDGAACAYNMMDVDNKLSVALLMHIRSYGYGYDVIHPTVRNMTYQALEM